MGRAGVVAVRWAGSEVSARSKHRALVCSRGRRRQRRAKWVADGELLRGHCRCGLEVDLLPPSRGRPAIEVIGDPEPSRQTAWVGDGW